MRKRPAERGFTLIELMIVVAIIAVLAGIVIPTFMRESRKTKSNTEIVPMFAELATREQQYKMENGSYLAATACPASPSSTEQDASSCISSTGPWYALRVQPHSTRLRCSYTITVAAAGTDPATLAPAWVTGLVTPAESWFFILGQCNADGDTTFAEFFQASWDTRIQSKDEAE